MRQRVAHLIARLDALHSRALRGWYQRTPLRRRWRIAPYRGFGTFEELAVSGRVLRSVSYREPNETDSRWRNVGEFIKRLESDELPGARVRVTFGDVASEVVADDEGFFSASLALAKPLERAGWHLVRLDLVDRSGEALPGVATTAEVLVPSTSARFGIISDIDDTVVWSNVAHKLAMLAMLAQSNSRTRKPFNGVAALYRAFHDGVTGNEANPVFYVSSSPWNLYEPLIDFLDSQHLPKGPLVLTDIGEQTWFERDRHRLHKGASINRILRAYPTLSFVLIGDSGEQDPEIYADVVREHPGRVRGIYIRSIDRNPARVETIARLIETVHYNGVPLVLTLDSEAAAVHAAEHQLISANAVDGVRADQRLDRAAPVNS
ncbi:MAG TPA: phosphatase domain-containing protein [Casimicrobiaceae bacterium]|nr:phosphatase domain-containing protein [Casimicrobiaceae bacterium]